MRCDIYSKNSSTYQFCDGEQNPQWFVYALEAPNGHKAEAAIFFVSTIMFVLGGLLFILSIFGRLSGRATLNSTVRIFLYVSFSLFLPLMSYMFSQAKDEAQHKDDTIPVRGLPVHAQVILMWMLLVELLRKKVDAILAAMSSSPLEGVHQQTIWDAIDQIVRIAWIGYLIYLYAHGIQKSDFIILWVLTLIKPVQRVAAVELAKCSFAVGENAHLVVGYATQMMEEEEEGNDEQDEEESNSSGPALMKKCWYTVTGEERLKREAGPDGYRVELPTSDKKDLITIGDIWELAEDGDMLLAAHPKLKDLCVSFALFKLLRARFKNFQVNEVVNKKTCNLIFQGLGGSGGISEDNDNKVAERAFHVIELELNFVHEYYHSVVAIAFASPWLFLANYIFVVVIVVNQVIMVLFLTGTEDLLRIIGCLAHDIVKFSHRTSDLFKCLFHKLTKIIIMMFSSFNILVSLMLVLTFVLMEAWEFVVYMLSDWFLVSLLCEYARRPKWRSSSAMRKAFGALLWVKNIRKRVDMRFHQYSVLELRRHTLQVMISKVLQNRFLGLPSVPVPREVKHAIFASLQARDGVPLGKGEVVLQRHGYSHLVWACESRSITEVILMWHIATSLFEMKSSTTLSQQKQETVVSAEKVATTLSKYCAYLVECAPELLPEDCEGSKRVYKAVNRDLRSALRKQQRRKAETKFEYVMKMEGIEAVANMGVDLGRRLMEQCGEAAQVWVVLAELWTELVIYIAPSNNTEGHAQALTNGGEFITILWAMVTHFGFTRPPS